MSNVYGSPTDELGSNSTLFIGRKIEDFAVFNATSNRWIANRDSGEIIRRAQIITTFPILITAGQSLRLRNGVNFNNLFIYAGAADTPMFMTLPMKRDFTTSFDDNGGTLRVTAPNTLNVDDVVKIIGSREKTYNGNHTVTGATTTTFDLDDVLFTNTDTTGEYIQVQLKVSSIVAGGINTETVLTVVNHPFAVDDWINVYDIETSDLTQGSFQISAQTTTTITIDTPVAPIVVGGTALIDTGIATFDLDHEFFVNFPDGQNRIFMQLSGSFSSSLTSVVVVLRVGMIGFEIGETRDFEILGVQQVTALRESFNWVSLDDLGVDIKSTFIDRLTVPFETEDYLPIFSFGSAGNSQIILDDFLFQLDSDIALLDINPFLGDDLSMTLIDLRNGRDAKYFSAGYFARAESVIVNDGFGFVQILIDDTSRYRDGDSILITESSSYNNVVGLITAIASTSITLDTSFVTTLSTDTTGTVGDNLDGTINITVDDTTNFLAGDFITILGTDPDYDGTFELLEVVAGDILRITGTSLGTITTQGSVTGNSRILTQDTTLASITQIDPRLTAINDDDLKNSMAVAQANLSTATVVTIGTINLYVPINGTDWLNPFLERFTGDSGNNGTITYSGLETADFIVSWTCTLEESGGGTGDLECTVFLNGVEDTVIFLPAVYDNAGIIQISGNAIVELSTGDTLQLFVRNTETIDNINVTQSTLTIIRGG